MTTPFIDVFKTFIYPYILNFMYFIVVKYELDQCLYKYLKTNLPQPNIDITLRHKIFGPFSR